MRHSRNVINRKAVEMITKFENLQKPHGRTLYGRMFRYYEFGIWILQKTRDMRRGDMAMKIIHAVWARPIELGLKVAMGRHDRIYTFDMNATDMHNTKKKLWEGIKR